MSNNIMEALVDLPAEHEKNIFGQFDEHLKIIERTLNVTLIARDGVLKILGNSFRTDQAKRLMLQLLELSKRGNIITKQNVNYALSLLMEEKESALTEIDSDLICNTIQGRPDQAKNLRTEKLCRSDTKEYDCLWRGACGNRKDLSGNGDGGHRFPQ